MPCFSGRSEHKLLRKDCEPGCACCVNTTYSCGKIGCNDETIQRNNVEKFVCEIIKQNVEAFGCVGGVDPLDSFLNLPPGN